MSAPTDDHEGRPSAGEADSFGLPWAGRHLTAPAFADDQGDPDPDLLAQLRRPGPRTGEQEAALLAVLAHCRLLVPLVVAPPAASGEPEPSGTSPELAAVTLTGPDGQRALPVFTGLPALAAWDAAARPVPVTARDAAREALDRDCDVLVLDAASSHTAVLRPSMLSAVASGQPWTPAYRDLAVVSALAAAVRGEPAVVRHDLGPGAPGCDTVVLTLALRPGLGADEVHQLTLRLGELLGAQAGLRTRLDELVLRIRAAEEE